MTDRVVNQLLTELDGVENLEGIDTHEEIESKQYYADKIILPC